MPRTVDLCWLWFVEVFVVEIVQFNCRENIAVLFGSDETWATNKTPESYDKYILKLQASGYESS